VGGWRDGDVMAGQDPMTRLFEATMTMFTLADELMQARRDDPRDDLLTAAPAARTVAARRRRPVAGRRPPAADGRPGGAFGCGRVLNDIEERLVRLLATR
jgi:hypothetical protein